jgi:hypothetical protein
MVAGCILALWTAFGDDRSPDPDCLFAFLDVPIEVVPPGVIAGDSRCFGTLEFDEQGISMRVVMEATLDIKPLLELLALLGIINVVDELVDPVFNRTVHLIVSGVALLKGNRRLTLCSHDFHHDASCFFGTRRTPLGREKIPRLGWWHVDALFAR